MTGLRVLLHRALKKKRKKKTKKKKKEVILEHNRKMGRLHREIIPVGLNSVNEF